MKLIEIKLKNIKSDDKRRFLDNLYAQNITLVYKGKKIKMAEAKALMLASKWRVEEFMLELLEQADKL